MVRVNWLTSHMWDRCINKKHPLPYYLLVDTVVLHHAMSYDPTLQHLYLNRKVNDEGFYCHFATVKNMSTLYWYEARNDHKFNTGCVWSKRLYNLFTQKLGLEVQFKSSDGKSDTKYDRTINTNIKEVDNDCNGQVAKSNMETVDLPGDYAPQGFLS